MLGLTSFFFCVWKMMSGLVFVFFVVDGVVIEFWEVQEFT